MFPLTRQIRRVYEAWFGVDQGGIAEVKAGDPYPEAEPAPPGHLPPSGPYHAGRAAAAAIRALQEADEALSGAQSGITTVLTRIREGEL